MTISVATTSTILLGTAWTGTAPGAAATPSGTINSGSGTYIDATSYCQAVEVPMTSEMKDGETFGSVGFKVRYCGLKDGALTLTLLNDFATGLLDSKLYTLWSTQALTYFDVKPTSAARGTSNPSFVGAVYINDYKPMQVQVGNLVVMQYTWPTTGQFIRLTS